jgi:hypothetical protein
MIEAAWKGTVVDYWVAEGLMESLRVRFGCHAPACQDNRAGDRDFT